jgi:3D (Asp-Asp-Asp) domain-containing protein
LFEFGFLIVAEPRGVPFLHEKGLMLKEKRYANRKPVRLFRIATVIIGFGCILHLTHRECARVADGHIQDKVVSSFVVDSNQSTDAEEFHATAYCVAGITKSGAMTAPGRVAADPEVIPLGSMIYVDSPLMGGIYQVLDTGALVKGKIIDIFIPSYESCVEFGRRMVKVKVLRYGFLGYPPKTQPDK